MNRDNKIVIISLLLVTVICLSDFHRQQLTAEPITKIISVGKFDNLDSQYNALLDSVKIARRSSDSMGKILSNQTSTISLQNQQITTLYDSIKKDTTKMRRRTFIQKLFHPKK